MMHFCTYSDIKYVYKGLALNQSLSETIECDYTLYYLCLDDETFELLSHLELPNIKPVHIHSLQMHDIKRAKQLGADQFGDKETVFIWSLSAIWINFCLKKLVPKDEILTYADADIYFYTMPDANYFLVDRSVGIHKHRFTPKGEKYDVKTNPVGEFNVGVMMFKNDYWGNYICETWKNWILNTHKPDYELYGTCGDQKWLDKMYNLYRQHISVFDEEVNIGHLAPWNYMHCEKIDFEKKEIYRHKWQILLFYHFSHFNTDFKKWTSSNHGEWKPEINEEVKKIYEHYFETLKKIHTSTQIKTTA